MSACPRCGDPVPPGTHGQTRKWCSENCRKRSYDKTRYLGVCSECGERTSRRDHGLCRPCYEAEVSATHDGVLERVARMYNEGRSLREIAAALGRDESQSLPEITYARRRGMVGYRHRGYSVDGSEGKRS